MDRFERSELITKTDGGNIFSLVYKPTAAQQGKRCPVVIYAHGMHSNHLSGDAYARELANRGYVVCCMDFRGGHNSFSDGHWEDLTLFTQQADLDAVYDNVCKQPFADANNIFLMGASMGGAVAALAAGARPGLFKGLILLYPAFSLPSEVERQFPDPVQLPKSARLASQDPASVKELDEVGHDFLATLYGFDIYGPAARYQGHVLILHGTADKLVSSSYSIRATRTYRHAKLELISGAGHGFKGGEFKYATRVIVDFLDEECDLADESGLEGDLNFAGGMGGMGL